MSRFNTIQLNNNVWIDHSICYTNDIVYFSQLYSTNTAIMSIDSGGHTYNSKNEYIGSFRLSDTDLWEFYSSDDSFKITTGNKCLIKAQVKVFKDLVSRGIILVNSD